MIVLPGTTKSLQIVLSGSTSVNPVQWMCHFSDDPVGNPNTYNVNTFPQSTYGTINSNVAVTMVGVGGGNLQYSRRVRTIQIYNNDTSAATITVQILDSAGPTTTKIYAVTLQTGENLEYEEGYGFAVTDVNGALKNQSSVAVTTAVSSQASSLASFIIPSSIASTSSQASSLAAAIVVASVNSTSSQASSMAALVPASVSSAASLGLLVSSLQSATSVQSFTSTTWSTASSTVSRLKSSTGW